jgi:hypothetical protein
LKGLSSTYDTNALVITTLQVAITGKERLFIYYALPCGMRLRSLANFVGCVVGFLNVFLYTPAEPPPCRRVIL